MTADQIRHEIVNPVLRIEKLIERSMNGYKEYPEARSILNRLKPQLSKLISEQED